MRLYAIAWAAVSDPVFVCSPNSFVPIRVYPCNPCIPWLDDYPLLLESLDTAEIEKKTDSKFRRLHIVHNLSPITPGERGLGFNHRR